MSSQALAAAVRVTPVAIPSWPGLRYADLIQSGLRDLDRPGLDAMLHAIAVAMDRYLAVAPCRVASVAAADLDGALDDVLRLLAPVIGSGVGVMARRAGGA